MIEKQIEQLEKQLSVARDHMLLLQDKIAEAKSRIAQEVKVDEPTGIIQPEPEDSTGDETPENSGQTTLENP